jgi:LysR family transcriptional regulator, benzoate and cis,cis-muconate-responsive activator of ben and cat genes
MELRHLRTFVAVGHTLSFTKAAEELHLSQPPVSRRIQELEDEIGAPLFLRSPSGTNLTEAGEYLMIETERLLEGLETSCKTAKAIALDSRSVKVGCVDFLSFPGFTRLLKALELEYPAAKVELLTMSTEAQQKALISGSLDIGIVRSWVSGDELAFEPFARETLTLIYPSAWGQIDPARGIQGLAKRPFVGFSTKHAAGFVSAVLEACAARGVSPKPRYECDDGLSVISLVAAGLGWSIVPDIEPGLDKSGPIFSLPMEEAITVGICARMQNQSPMVQELLRLAREACDET